MAGDIIEEEDQLGWEEENSYEEPRDGATTIP